MNIEIARKLHRRAFYDCGSKTIRTCPENYLIAVKRGDYFSCEGYDLDGQLSGYRSSIKLILANIRYETSPDVLADILGLIIPDFKNNL